MLSSTPRESSLPRGASESSKPFLTRLRLPLFARYSTQIMGTMLIFLAEACRRTLLRPALNSAILSLILQISHKLCTVTDGRSKRFSFRAIKGIGE